MKSPGVKSTMLISLFFLVSVQVSLSQQVFLLETDTFRIENIKPGCAGPGINFFTAVVMNKTNQAQLLGLDLIADPMFSLIRFQRQYAFHLGPFEKKEIEAAYTFFRVTTEAFLRVRFGIPRVSKWGVDAGDFFFDNKYDIRDVDSAQCFDLSHFTKTVTNHFQIYCFKGSLSEREIDQISYAREAAFCQISDQLQITPTSTVRLVFYPDAETKTNETGHQGSGLANGNNIIEIYNDIIKLDPFHEIAHIIAKELGDPPALFNEGFAVYISEKLGGDALMYLGSPGKTVDDVTATNWRNNNLIPLDKLFKFTEIGSTLSQPSIAYPEAASFVKFIIEKYGIQKFRNSFEYLQNSNEPLPVEKNHNKFEEIYGITFPYIEQLWLHNLK